MSGSRGRTTLIGTTLMTLLWPRFARLPPGSLQQPSLNKKHTCKDFPRHHSLRKVSSSPSGRSQTAAIHSRGPRAMTLEDAVRRWRAPCGIGIASRVILRPGDFSVTCGPLLCPVVDACVMGLAFCMGRIGCDGGRKTGPACVARPAEGLLCRVRWWTRTPSVLQWAVSAAMMDARAIRHVARSRRSSVSRASEGPLSRARWWTGASWVRRRAWWAVSAATMDARAIRHACRVQPTVLCLASTRGPSVSHASWVRRPRGPSPILC